jgi:methionine synthase II (cobalamin-independent)
MKLMKLAHSAEHFGSLLRSAALSDAHAGREHYISAATRLNTFEDSDVENIITGQEDSVLQLTTNGAFRRAWQQFGSFCKFEVVELFKTDSGRSAL